MADTRSGEDTLKKRVFQYLSKYPGLRSVDIHKLLVNANVPVSFSFVAECVEEYAEKKSMQSRGNPSSENGSQVGRSRADIGKAPKHVTYVNPSSRATRQLECTTHASETRTLIDDVYRAAIHEDIERRIRADCGDAFAQSPLADDFEAVLARATAQETRRISVPTFMHELVQYPSAYSTRFSTLQRLLGNRCTKTPLESTVVPHVLYRNHIQLDRLRSEAPPPPELYEPLAAFHGTTRFSLDPAVRLTQKLQGIQSALARGKRIFGAQQGRKRKKSQEEWSDAQLKALLERLPENVDTASMLASHPFRNHAGFRTAVPTGVSGSIKMGAPATALDTQLAVLRYPTLQRVAFDLPVDPAYRAATVQAIETLERTRSWDFKRKLEFVNTLKTVQANLAPYQHYVSFLDAALPKQRKSFMVNSKMKRRPKGIDGTWRLFWPLRSIEARKKLLVKKR